MKKQLIEGIAIIISLILLIVGFAILLNNIIKVNKDITNFEYSHRILDSQLDSINHRLDRLEQKPDSIYLITNND